MKKLTALALLLACASAAPAQDQVLGLLTLPELFGTGPCDEFTPSEIVLFSAPDSATAIGVARVAKHWTFHSPGSCEGLLVKVHLIGNDSPTELPVQEYAYEAPAAVVVQQREHWFRIRLENGTAWLRASDRAHFHPLTALLSENLSYVASPDELGLASSPGGSAREVERELMTADRHRHVRVLESRQVSDRLWLRVALLSHSVCEAAEEPRVVAQGWVSAHTEAGEPTIWFFSRGC